MKIKFIKTLCLGCKRCAKTCPEVFAYDEPKVKLIKVETDLETAVMAYEDCPAGAIKITEE
jgi:ferredoxin